MARLIINCDWGTTRFRSRAVDVARFDVAAEFRSDDGVASLAARHASDDRPGRYRAIVTAAVQQLIATLGSRLTDAPVLVSGMASSSIGWQDVAYARLPMLLDGSQLPWTELEPIESDLGSHRVILISGACTASDVMRGEETELTGLFTLPAMARHAEGALVIKPGTHSKHLRVNDRKLVGLQTFMTGELFDLLGRHGILRHSLDEATAEDRQTPDCPDDLRAGARHGRSTPLSAALFRVRTRQLLDGLSGRQNRAFLSGVLLGHELAYLLDTELGNLPLVLCATSAMETPYRMAIEELGLAGRLTAISPAEVELLSARGQAQLWHRLAGSTDISEDRQSGN